MRVLPFWVGGDLPFLQDYQKNPLKACVSRFLFVFLPCRSEFCYACCRDTKVSENSDMAKGPEQQTIA